MSLTLPSLDIVKVIFAPGLVLDTKFFNSAPLVISFPSKLIITSPDSNPDLSAGLPSTISVSYTHLTLPTAPYV